MSFVNLPSDLIKLGTLTYFTFYPYNMYNTATNVGNMAYAGVGLGLIHSQQLFWMSNTCVCIVFYNNYNDIHYYYVNYWLLVISAIFYGYSFVKLCYLLRFLR